MRSFFILYNMHNFSFSIPIAKYRSYLNLILELSRDVCKTAKVMFEAVGEAVSISVECDEPDDTIALRKKLIEWGIAVE